MGIPDLGRQRLPLKRFRVGILLLRIVVIEFWGLNNWNWVLSE